MGLPNRIPPPPGPGRPKGSSNRTSGVVLDILTKAGIEPVERLLALMPQLEPNEQATVLMKLLTFCYPTLKAIEVQKDINQKITVTTANVAELCRLAREATPLTDTPPDGQIETLEASISQTAPEVLP